MEAVHESLRPDGAVDGVAGGAEASLVPHGLLLLLGLCHLSLHLVIAVAVPSACRCTIRKGRAGRTYSSSWPLSWPSSLLLLVFVKFGLMIGLEHLHLRRSKRCRGGLSRHMGDPPSTRTPPKTSQMMKRKRGNSAIRGAKNSENNAHSVAAAEEGAFDLAEHKGLHNARRDGAEEVTNGTAELELEGVGMVSDQQGTRAGPEFDVERAEDGRALDGLVDGTTVDRGDDLRERAALVVAGLTSPPSTLVLAFSLLMPNLGTPALTPSLTKGGFPVLSTALKA